MHFQLGYGFAKKKMLKMVSSLVLLYYLRSSYATLEATVMLVSGQYVQNNGARNEKIKNRTIASVLKQ